MKHLIFLVLLFTVQPALAGSSSSLNKELGRVTVASCSGSFLGLNDESVVVTFDKASSSYKILWIDVKKQETVLSTIKKYNDEKFELQCMATKEASDTKKSLAKSEGVHDFLEFAAGNGLLCYFTDETTAKCWTYDKKKKSLVDAGGWQT